MRTDPEIVDVITDIRRRAQHAQSGCCPDGRTGHRTGSSMRVLRGTARHGRYGMSDGSSFAAALMLRARSWTGRG